jgi:hypothetical protein
MIKHLPQRSSHTRPPRLLPIDSVHGLVQEETDSPSIPGRCVDGDFGIESRAGQGDLGSGLVVGRSQSGGRSEKRAYRQVR